MDDGILLNITSSLPNKKRNVNKIANKAEQNKLDSQDGGSQIKRQEGRPSLKRKRPTASDVETDGQGQITKDGRVAGHVVSSLFDYHDPLPSMVPAPKVAQKMATAAPAASISSSFEELKLAEELIKTMQDKMQVTVPSAIQREVLPIMLSTAKDVFIRAETGSGKTLAYLLPIVHRLCALPAELQSRQKGSYALIIAPTRELAQQIYTVLDTLLNSRKARWMVGVLLIGGEKKKSEKARLRKGATIVIATPGRLKDHLESTQVLDVRNIQWVVLDEGDRLMDLGFEASIIEILDIVKQRQGRRVDAASLPERRVTVICSATAKENVTKLGEQSLEEAVFIDGRDIEGSSLPQGVVAPSQLKQEYITVPTKLRLVTLVAAVKKAFSARSCKKVIIFLSCGDTVDYHFSLFTRPTDGSAKDTDASIAFGEAPVIKSGLVAYKLHGSLPQQIRTKTLQAFAKCAEPAVLLCTDVASRGLDLQVDFIIQYDPPFSIDDYTHRIGRTARAGRAGSALLFMLKSEVAYLDLIRDTLHSELQELNVKFLLKASFGQDFEDEATKWQMTFEKWVNQANNIEMAKTAFSSHVRAYVTHTSSERKCFPVHALQLGHVAKSFGLREAPSGIANSLPRKAKVKPSERAQVAALEDQQKFGPTDIQRRMRQSIAAQSRAIEFNVI